MKTSTLLSVLFLVGTLCSFEASASELSATEQAKALKTAGFTFSNNVWHSECYEEDSPTYTPAHVEKVADLNGDSLPDAIIYEISSCYGMSYTGYSIVSKQPDSNWKLIFQGSGVPEILKTKSSTGWSDIQITGPGFCFTVYRWNGKEYIYNRSEYEGKACKPN